MSPSQGEDRVLRGPLLPPGPSVTPPQTFKPITEHLDSLVRGLPALSPLKPFMVAPPGTPGVVPLHPIHPQALDALPQQSHLLHAALLDRRGILARGHDGRVGRPVRAQGRRGVGGGEGVAALPLNVDVPQL